MNESLKDERGMSKQRATLGFFPAANCSNPHLDGRIIIGCPRRATPISANIPGVHRPFPPALEELVERRGENEECDEECRKRQVEDVKGTLLPIAFV